MDQTLNPVKKANDMRRNMKQGQDVALSHGLGEQKNVGNIQGSNNGII